MHSMLPAGLAALAAAVLLYAFLRRRLLWRYELDVLGLIPLVALVAYEPRATGAAGALLLGCYSTGRWLARRIGLQQASAFQAIAISTALGLGLLEICLFMLGLAGLYKLPVFAGLVIVFLLPLAGDARNITRELRAARRNWSGEEQAGAAWMAPVFVLALAAVLFGAASVLTPCTIHDPLANHLSAARFYAEQGTLRPMPYLPYSYYPQGLEILMAAAHSLGGLMAAQMIAAAFFPIALLLVYGIARESGAERRAAFAAAVFASSIPFVHWTGTIPKNDIACAAFTLAALYAYLRWRGSGQAAWLFAGVFLLAMSFWIKHTALYGAIPAAMLFGYAALKQRNPAGAAIVLAAVFLAIAPVWIVRTWSLRGDPLFPSSVEETTRFAVNRHYLDATRKLLHYVQLPWKLHFQGLHNFERQSTYPLGILLLLFFPVWFLRKKAAPVPLACVFFLAAYSAYWVSYPLPILRYAIPVFALLAGFTALHVADFYERATKAVRVSVFASLVGGLMFLVPVMLSLEVNAAQAGYLAKKTGRTGYLRAWLRGYPAIEALQVLWQPGDRVMCLMNCSTAYTPDPGSLFCVPATRNLPAPERLAYIFHLEKFTLVLIPRSPIGEGFLDAITEDTVSSLVYEDAEFAIHRVWRTPDAVTR